MWVLLQASLWLTGPSLSREAWISWFSQPFPSAITVALLVTFENGSDCVNIFFFM